MDPKYVVDTSMLLRRNNKGVYDEAAFPVQWRNFDRLVEQGKIISIDLVEIELTRYNHEEYNEWIDNYKYVFKKLDNKSLKSLEDLNQRYDELSQKNFKKKRIADIPLVAFAKSNNFTLVNQETYNYKQNMSQKKIKIPTLCDLEGAKCTMESCDKFYANKSYAFECIDFVELIKRENLQISI